MATTEWLGASPQAVKWLNIGGVAAALAAVIVPMPAQAVVRSGISITPVYSELSLQKSDTQVPYELTLTNFTSVDQAFKLSAVDFGSLNEEGGVAFLGQAVSELERPHGLSAWMILDHTDVTIPAGGSADVRGHIENRASLASGGHYGAVLATALTNTGPGTEKSDVGVKQVLSSLILLTKQDGSRTALEMVGQVANGNWFRLPTLVDHRFHNTGNVHTVPRGVVQVTDPAGRVVRRAAINESSGAVLPGGFRRYHANLDVVKLGWVPGRYRITTNFRPDGVEATSAYITTFWYGGAPIFWLILIFVVLAIGALSWWLWWRPKKRQKPLKN